MSIFLQNINLTEGTLNYRVSGYSPLELTVYPKNLYSGLTPKIRKIVYRWQDGTSEIKEFKPSLNNNSYLDFPEIGNPLNYPVKKTIFSLREDSEEKINTINVDCYFFGSNDVKTYKIEVLIKKPMIEGFEDGSIFQEIKLIDSRMFGPNNTLIYVFETKNPNYILMSTVNWELLPEKAVERKLPPIRPYKFLLPFDKTVDVGFKYEDVKLLRSNPSENSIDSGGGYV